MRARSDHLMLRLRALSGAGLGWLGQTAVMAVDVIRSATSAVLAGIGALHVAWGLGNTWPYADQAALTENVVGAEVAPSPAACFVVAGLLGTAALFIAGFPTRDSGIGTLGRATVATVLGTRGILGLAGRTDLISPGSDSATFRRNDRTKFAPLCLALAAGAAHSVRG
jgi:hypothetical protein